MKGEEKESTNEMIVATMRLINRHSLCVLPSIFLPSFILTDDYDELLNVNNLSIMKTSRFSSFIPYFRPKPW
jgi:hypothetical protein